MNEKNKNNKEADKEQMCQMKYDIGNVLNHIQ